MKKQSAGLLVYRIKESRPEVFIVHNGGPFWAKKDKGVWSLPKGEIDEGEEPLAAAKREFTEETGFEPPEGEYLELGEIKYPKGNKSVVAWAIKGDLGPGAHKSNTFEIEWPPRSGWMQQFQEIDRAEWFTLEKAAEKLFAPNLPFLERLAELLEVPLKTEPGTPPEQGLLF
jgi:predicted NUDIX family NTP pyrophosphohydrolase